MIRQVRVCVRGQQVGFFRRPQATARGRQAPDSPLPYVQPRIKSANYRSVEVGTSLFVVIHVSAIGCHLSGRDCSTLQE